MTPYFQLWFKLSNTNSPEMMSLFMRSIITNLLLIIQYQDQQIRWLVLFIYKYISLSQWAHDDIHSVTQQTCLAQ